MNWLYWHSVFHIYGLYHIYIYIYIYIRSAFYVFSVRKGGEAVNFGSLFSFIIDIFCVFSDDVDIFGWNSRWSSSFCVFECFCSLLGFMSDDCSFVVAFVDCLFKLDIYLYISMYIQAEYGRLGVVIFVLLFTVPVISFLLLRVVLLRLQVAEEFLFISARRRAYHL